MFDSRARSKIALMPIAMLLLMLSFGLNARVTFAQNFAYNGFTNYPYPLTTSATQDVIDLMEKHDLNVYRMSIRPSYSEGSHPYRPQLIQYYLDNTPDDWIIIIDANHLIDWDPFEDGHAQQLKSRLKQVCTDFPDTSRVWVELFNEIFCNYNEHYDYAQELIDYVRSEGFTHTLVVNRLYTTTYGMSGSSWGWNRLNDPLDRTYQGYHPYFQSSQDRANAFNFMQTGVNMGIKLINTEIGANSFSTNEWTQSQVDALQDFTQKCAQIGVGNCIWISWGTDWYYELLSYGYDFDNPAGPSPPPPPEATITVKAMYDGNYMNTQVTLTGPNAYTNTKTTLGEAGCTFSGLEAGTYTASGSYSRASDSSSAYVSSGQTETITLDFGSAPPPTTLPFRDDFTADLSKWTIHSGASSLVNGVLDGVSSGEGLIVAGDVDWVDYALRSRVQLMPDSSAMEVAFVVRFVDVNNFYWIGLGCWRHRVSISRMVNGASEELAFAGERAELTAKSYDVEVICAGDVLQLYVDGELELEWNDTAHCAGAIGIRLYNSHVQVEYVEATTAHVSYALCDVNHDGSVNVVDLSIVSWSLSSVPGDLKWNPDVDLNKDGIIDILDLVIVVKNFTY